MSERFQKRLAALLSVKSLVTLAAAVLTQLGDTLATIAVQRSLCGKAPSGT